MFQFVTVDSQVLTDGLIEKVGVGPFSLLILLMRYVCRTQDKNWASPIRDAWEAGFLVAAIRQGKLAKEMGVCRKSINEWVKKLEDVGFVKKVSVEGRKSLGYVLGCLDADKEVWLYQGVTKGGHCNALISNKGKDLSLIVTGVVTPGYRGAVTHGYTGIDNHARIDNFTEQPTAITPSAAHTSREVSSPDLGEGFTRSMSALLASGDGGAEMGWDRFSTGSKGSEKTSEVAKKGPPSKVQKPVGEWKTPDCLNYFWWRFKEKSGGKEMLPFFGKDLGQMKHLLEGVGPEKVKEMVDRLVDGWDDFRIKVKVDADMPSVPLLVGFRHTLASSEGEKVTYHKGAHAGDGVMTQADVDEILRKKKKAVKA